MKTQNNMETQNINIRRLALESLIEILENNRPLHLVMAGFFDKYQFLDKKDRAFYKSLIFSTVENVYYIDFVIDHFSKVKHDKMKPVIRDLIRMSAAQILYMDRVPDSAAINEAVKIAKKKSFAGLTGFVNAVLRNISRMKDEPVMPDGKDEIYYLSVMYSVPCWVVREWLEYYGKEEAVKILEALRNNKNELTIRPDTLKTDRDELAERLKSNGLEVAYGKIAHNSLTVRGVDRLTQLEEFRQGLFYVQDESSQLCVECAGIEPGMTVLDVCAAPGGKSLYAAEFLKGKGLVVARDLTSYKASLIEENIRRMDAENIKVEVWDALAADEKMIEKADVVFADLPCSGLGVMSGKPDIRLKAKEENSIELSKLQKDILTVVSGYVKPGGALIYSTCTNTRRENIENFEFIKDNTGLLPESLDEFLPKELLSGTTAKGYIELKPKEYGQDGFFISRFRKPL